MIAGDSFCLTLDYGDRPVPTSRYTRFKHGDMVVHKTLETI